MRFCWGPHGADILEESSPVFSQTNSVPPLHQQAVLLFCMQEWFRACGPVPLSILVALTSGKEHFLLLLCCSRPHAHTVLMKMRRCLCNADPHFSCSDNHCTAIMFLSMQLPRQILFTYLFRLDLKLCATTKYFSPDLTFYGYWAWSRSRGMM